MLTVVINALVHRESGGNGYCNHMFLLYKCLKSLNSQELDRLESHVTFLSVVFVTEHDIPAWLAKTNRTTSITLAWEKDSLVFVNVYTEKEWNKAIHNGLTLPLVLTWYCHASQNSMMAAEVFPRMTSRIKNSRWRPDLLKACILQRLFKVLRFN